jgi:hypothetical protein
MTRTQSIAAARYRQARRDARRLDPDSLAHAAAECAADLAREQYWTEKARSATQSPRP